MTGHFSKGLQAFSLFIAFVFAVWIIRAILIVPPVQINQIGMGEGTLPYFPNKHGMPVQVNVFKDIDLIATNVGRNAKNKDVLLWLGNSQLFGINQMKPGQVNATDILFDYLQHLNKFLTAFAIPNANLQEHYVSLQYIVTRYSVQQLIIPVFFDDLRESGLREDLVNTEVKKILLSETREPDVAIELLHQFAGQTDSENNVDMKALHHTTQESTERLLSNCLESVSTVWRNRADVRINIIYNYLFSYRNTLFGISPNSKRKIIPARYQLNMASLDGICRFCQDKGLKMLVYIPPIRNDIEQPYIKVEYETFKKDLGQLQSKYGFTLLNLENLVPAKYWGLKRATTIGSRDLEIDFMHFQAPGHRLLADTIFSVIKNRRN